MNPAPPQPPAKNADRKAVAAYYSELRRWATALARWEADLDQRENELAADTHARIAHKVGADDMYDEDEECDCTEEEADAGCDCPKCMNMRSYAEKLQPIMEAAGAGDEIEWLEALWNLPDKPKRKKK